MIRLTTLYFDLFSGAAGDMILGALIDAGVPLAEVRRALGTLAIAPDTVWTERVSRAGVAATKFCVRGEDPPDPRHQHEPALAHAHAGTPAAAHGHDHAHEPAAGDGERHAHDRRAHRPDVHGHEPVSHMHGAAPGHHHAHRTLAEIGALIDGSALSPEGKARARHLFERLGAAEAAIHGTTMEQVHLHEVGALDSVIDVVGTVFALESLGVRRIVSSALNVGGGTIQSAHGRYPVPAPATLRLLDGVPVYAGPQQVELVTPTGALLVTEYAESFGPMPRMRVRATGYGAGSRDLPGTPNVTRVILGDEDADGAWQTILVMEAEIDDMNPQIFGALMDRLLGAGAYDVFYTPIQMKKSRPGTLLTIVAPPSAHERLSAVVFAETTTIGIRFREMLRECLDRETVTVETPLGGIRMKVARRNGTLMNAAPEFDDCARLAQEHGRPIKDVQALATRTFLDRDRASYGPLRSATNTCAST